MRILLLAPGANPNIVTSGIIGYSLAEALAGSHQVTLVIQSRDIEAVRQAKSGFRAIESISSPWLDRIYGWIFRSVFRGDRGNVLWTAVRYPLPVVFEWRVWRRFRDRIRKGEFDVVLRILPIVPMMPSPLAYFMRNGPTPFVIGPLNGSLPSSQLPKHRATAGYWAAGLRGFYRYLPFARSTYSKARAIIVGSSHTFAEFSRFKDKLFFVPGENGLVPSVLEDRGSLDSLKPGRLELVFVGRLVPLKACDLALRGASRLLRKGEAHFSVIGGGPERARLEALADELQIRDQVTFLGWVSHSEVLARLREAEVLVFPSLRDFGAGVVFEALAKGAVPVVVDQGGPGDIVRNDVGYRIRLGDEALMVEEIAVVLEHLASDREHLQSLRRQGLAYAREELTWERKAEKIINILFWTIGAGPKPISDPPKPL